MEKSSSSTTTIVLDESSEEKILVLRNSTAEVVCGIGKKVLPVFKTVTIGAKYGIDRILKWLEGQWMYQVARSVWAFCPEGLQRAAKRIGATIVDTLRTVLNSFWNFMEVALTNAKFWTLAHAAGLEAWNEKEKNGYLAQIYAYSRIIAGFILELAVQSLERAMKVHKVELTEEHKNQISGFLTELFGELPEITEEEEQEQEKEQTE